MSLLSTIERFKTAVSYTVTREGTETITLGVVTPGATSTFPIVASIQPVSGSDLQLLPEGEHAKESRVLYTATQLIARSETVAGDSVAIDSEAWRVVRVDGPWIHRGETHYRVFVVRTVAP